MQLFYISPYATLKHVVSKQIHFNFLHVLVLTTVLDHSQVVIVPKTVIHKLMYPS
jgi:hypothetical protein